MQFLAKYGKSYTSKNELPSRYQIFKQRYQLVQSFNSKSDATSKLAINRFADMTYEELSLGIELPYDFYQIEKVNPHLLDIMDKNLTKNVDWRDSDVIGPVHDQGKCQSCWAFTTT